MRRKRNGRAFLEDMRAVKKLMAVTLDPSPLMAEGPERSEGG